MSNTITKTSPQNLEVTCLDCGEAKKFPNKGFGRIAATLYRQDHKCK